MMEPRKGIDWINAGLLGDRLENVHWRVEDYADSMNIEKIVLDKFINISHQCEHLKNGQN